MDVAQTVGLKERIGQRSDLADDGNIGNQQHDDAKGGQRGGQTRRRRQRRERLRPEAQRGGGEGQRDDSIFSGEHDRENPQEGRDRLRPPCGESQNEARSRDA